MTSTIARIGPKLAVGAAALALFAWQALPAGADPLDATGGDVTVAASAETCDQHAVDVLLAPEGDVVTVQTSECAPDISVTDALPTETGAIVSTGSSSIEPAAPATAGLSLVAAP